MKPTRQKDYQRLPDFRCEHCRSTILLWAVSDEGEAWTRENIPTDIQMQSGIVSLPPEAFRDMAIIILDESLTLQDADSGRYLKAEPTGERYA